MIKFLTENILLSGLGISFILAIIARILPNEKLKDVFDKIGSGTGKIIESLGKILEIFGTNVSKIAILRIGKGWEHIEDFIENSIVICASSVYEGYRKVIPVNTLQYLWKKLTIGLNSDNNK